MMRTLFRRSFFWCLVLLILSWMLPQEVWTQEPVSGSVRGIVIDESTGTPLELVNVVLRHAGDSTLVGGGATNKDGQFDLANVQPGQYTVRFTMIGYKEKTTATFPIDAGHRHLNLGEVRLVPAAISLDEVLVTGQQALFNNTIDRKIYNVDQDLLSKSGSASEVLQNVPSVEVDMDGNVTLRGSANVLILINGKNSPLMGKSRASVLEQIPASSIEKIEVITNPSAKYNPDGTSGIINIVLRKNTAYGTNGTITANVGNSSRYNGNVRVNYNPGGYNMFASYGIRSDNRNRNNTDARSLTDPSSPPGFYREDLASYASPFAHMASLGLDYDIDTRSSFGLVGNYFYNSFTRNDTSAKVYQDANHVVTGRYNRNRHDPEFEKEYDLTATVSHKFEKKDHELKLEFTASNAPEQEDNHYTNVNFLPSSPTTYDNALIKQTEGQEQIFLDYTNPLTDDSKLEAGYAGEFNRLDQDYGLSFYDPVQLAFVQDAARTNHFLFHESIHAVYGTYEHSFGNFGFLAGLRMEQSFRSFDLFTLSSKLSNDYFSLYPTLHLSYKLSDAMEWQLNYSRRVRRPESDDLNPFPEYRDPKTYNVGNPALLPEYIHSIELGYHWQNDQLSLLPSIYYRYTYNAFTSVTNLLPDSSLVTTHVNLSNDRAVGMELVMTANIDDWFTAHANVNGFHDQIDASNLGYVSNKSTIIWSGAITCDFNVTKTSMIQVNSNYHAARLTPQGERKPSSVLNLGFRQELLNGKLTVVATAADLFKTLRRESRLMTSALDQTVINTRDSRIFYLGVTFHFGETQKKSKEDEMKYDDSI